MKPSKSLPELMISFGIDPSSPAGEGLRKYLALLEKWNAGINLTASTAWPDIGDFFAEALWAARFYPAREMTHIDIGSGAGFPAIPMRILLPSMRLSLVEPRAKRAAFLETAAAELGLEGTRVYCGRVEELLRTPPVERPGVISWKGVKLGSEALGLLRQAAGAETRLWLFHGARLPVEHPEDAARELRLVQREVFQGRGGWQLSIYAFRRLVSADSALHLP